MPEYLAPGVYVEEIATGPVPISGVSTSTAAMVGATEQGPIDGLPRLITSFADFQRLYGGYLPATPWGDTRFLAYAVQGFFENGGQRVYIQRVVNDNALPAGRDLQDGLLLGGINYLLTRPAQDMDLLKTSASLISSRGVQIGAVLTFIQVNSAGVEVRENATVTGINGDQVTFAATANRFTRAAVVLIPAPGGVAAAPTLHLDARNPGAWGDRLQITATPSTRTTSRLVAADLSTTLGQQNIPLTVGAIVQGDAHMTLGAGERALVRVGDTLRFGNSAATEDRVVTAFGGAADEVDFVGALALNYTIGANTVSLLTPVALRVPAATANVTVPIVATPGFLVGDHVIIAAPDGAVTGTINAIGGGNTSLTLNLDQPFAANRQLLPGMALHLASAGRNTNTVTIAGARNLYVGAALELENAAHLRTYAVVNAINGNQVQLSVNVPFSYRDGDTVRSCEFDLSIQLIRRNPVTQRNEVTASESFKYLSMAAGTPNYAVAILTDSSNLVTATDLASGNPAPFNLPTTIDRVNFTSWLNLQNGSDGDPPQPRHYRGQDNGPGHRTGIEALQDIESVSLILAPGVTEVSVQQALIDQCETLKYRFAVLDGPHGSDIQGIQDHRNNYDTHYAALYYPWVTVENPVDDTPLDVPPSGHMVGIYARTDVARGVHKAPANEVIQGITNLETIVNKREQDILNPTPVNINVLRDFRETQRGLRVYGARCITSDQDWKYINVRRLFIFLEASLDIGTQWAVFEPNDTPLWDRLIQSVSIFLTNVWRSGALMGATASQAFFVRCDRSTMTQDDIDNGRLIMVIGVSPVFPAEYVIIRIGQQVLPATGQ